MALRDAYTIGIDYGSNSVRCVVVKVRNGQECGTAVFNYPSGTAGVLTDCNHPHVARQRPADFLLGLEVAVKSALKDAAKTTGFAVSQVAGIGVDTTGSTPLPVDAKLQPLASQQKFAKNLNAQAWMWKDHSSVAEAEAITALAAKLRPHYLAKCGGTYSAEWFFAKIWHCLKTAPEVFAAAHTWIELADFIPAVLAGVTSIKALKIGVCAAGHKAMFNADWGGYPDAAFLGQLHPELGKLRARLCATAHSSNELAGRLCPAWAKKLGLPAGLAIAVGAFDAHLGAVGAGVATGRMVKIIGTSTCDCLVAPAGKPVPDIPGVCGIVKGSVLPGCFAIEAGQSAVGDIFNWFVTNVCDGDAALHARLTQEAAALQPGASGLLALDWHNGNRTILVDARLTGAVLGMTLHTTRSELYRAFIEATAFGARRILDRIEEYGVKVREVVACGGIAEKNPLFMQIYADVLGRPMTLSRSAQTCALGSAIMAAVAAGLYPTATAAQRAMCGFKDTIYQPVKASQKTYNALYALYRKLHDGFGVNGAQVDYFPIMKQLLELSRRAKA